MTTDIIKGINDTTDLGLIVKKQLRTRKGLAYKVDSSGDEMLLKIIDLKDDDGIDRTRSLQREAQILQDISQFSGTLFVHSGKLDNHFWLLRKWLTGKTASVHTQYIHNEPLSSDNKKRFIKDLIVMLNKVIQLEKIGYLHGDLQPSHFIFSEKSVHLIDLELAVKMKDSISDYRGALVHFVSPETAKGMLESATNIPLDCLSEIYSFCAVAFYLYTKVVPVAYIESMEDTSYDVPMNKILSSIMEGRVRSFAQMGVKPFPELEYILKKGLSYKQLERYQTFEDLREALEVIVTKFSI